MFQRLIYFLPFFFFEFPNFDFPVFPYLGDLGFCSESVFDPSAISISLKSIRGCFLSYAPSFASPSHSSLFSSSSFTSRVRSPLPFPVDCLCTIWLELSLVLLVTRIGCSARVSVHFFFICVPLLGGETTSIIFQELSVMGPSYSSSSSDSSPSDGSSSSSSSGYMKIWFLGYASTASTSCRFSS